MLNPVSYLKEKFGVLTVDKRRRRALSKIGGLSGPVAIILTAGIIIAGIVIIYFILTVPGVTTTHPYP